MKIGLMGCAHSHVNIYCTQWNRDASLDIQPMAVWDRDGARGARMAEQFGLQICDSPAALLERTDLGAVIVASETSLHAELVEVAAAAGKAIVLQKPMALTLAEGQRIAAAVASFFGRARGDAVERRRVRARLRPRSRRPRLCVPRSR